MQLYSSPISPFSARVRAVLYYKQLPFVDLGLPEQGLKCAEYLAMNPMGRIPLMLLDDGSVIPESETIVQYLEDAFPQPPLMPSDPRERAKVRTMIRVTENYIIPPTTRLFPQLDPAQRNTRTVADEVDRICTGLKYLEHYISDESYTYGKRITLADCCVFPSLHLCEIITAQLGLDGALKSAPRLAAYFEKAREDAHLGRIYEEVTTALRDYQH